MNLLTQFEDGDSFIRVLKEDDNRLWVIARDVADTLGYMNRDIEDIFNNVPLDYKRYRRIMLDGDEQDVFCVNEAGVLSFIACSSNPKALPYKKWFTECVLPCFIKPKATLKDDEDDELALKSYEFDIESAKILLHMIDYPSFLITDKGKAVLAYEIVKILTGNEYSELLN